MTYSISANAHALGKRFYVRGGSPDGSPLAHGRRGKVQAKRDNGQAKAQTYVNCPRDSLVHTRARLQSSPLGPQQRSAMNSSLPLGSDIGALAASLGAKDLAQSTLP